MYITIINDCSDDNVMSRQTTRAISLFNAPTSLVRAHTDIEAAGNIIDNLDAAEDREGVILVNVAPRSGKSHKWPNGTPFGYFKYKNTLIGSTIDGYTLSLVKKYGLTDTIHVFDIPTVMDAVIKKGLIGKEFKEYISKSQFRSFDFLPRVMKWVHEGQEIPFEDQDISEYPDMPDSVWWIDNFGNCKLTVTDDQVDFTPGSKLTTVFGDIECFETLRDVPDRTPGLTSGSSGLGDRRFLELVIQGESAAKRFGIETGMSVFEKGKKIEALKVELD